MANILRRVLDYLGANVRQTPLFMWIYLAVVIYMFRRVSRDFLGIGTRRKSILGRVKVALTRDEESIAECIVDPQALTESFASVGGLEEQKRTLTESVVWPFCHPEMFPAGALQAHPTGILLHGPPGTGKTLIARALAKELNGYFIEVRSERLLSKYVGESEKLAAAVFSLAEKLQPAVIFVDEIDALLSHRTDSDSAVYAHIKSIFLTKWDGLRSEKTKVIVVGATNRVRSLDEAVLRRLPIRLAVPMPDLETRRAILHLLLREQLSLAAASASSSAGGDFGDEPPIDIDALARWTEGCSGSDLRELCKSAAVIAMRGVMEAHKARLAAGSPVAQAPTNPAMKTSHFVEALQRTKKS